MLPCALFHLAPPVQWERPEGWIVMPEPMQREVKNRLPTPEQPLTSSCIFLDANCL